MPCASIAAWLSSIARWTTLTKVDGSRAAAAILPCVKRETSSRVLDQAAQVRQLPANELVQAGSVASCTGTRSSESAATTSDVSGVRSSCASMARNSSFS